MNAAFQVEGVRLALARNDSGLLSSEYAALRRQVEADGGMRAEDALTLIDAVACHAVEEQETCDVDQEVVESLTVALSTARRELDDAADACVDAVCAAKKLAESLEKMVAGRAA